MGGTSSKAVKRISALLSNGGAAEEDDGQRRQKSITSLASPFVFSRWGSMYIDEDGDVAHEFYVESASIDSNRKTVMRKITTNIKPQGEVPYDYPRLHTDLPIIICER